MGFGADLAQKCFKVETEMGTEWEQWDRMGTEWKHARSTFGIGL